MVLWSQKVSQQIKLENVAVSSDIPEMITRLTLQIFPALSSNNLEQFRISGGIF